MPFSFSPTEIEYVVRLVLAALFGGLIGLERERHGRAAGFRTHLLMGMGSCLAMIISQETARAFEVVNYAGAMRVDPGRIASYVMAGMGFLGAGVIVHYRMRVSGLTTAACLWVTAAVGLSVGGGFYLYSITATIISLFALMILKYAERLFANDRYYQLSVSAALSPELMGMVTGILREEGLVILSTGQTAELENGRIVLRFDIRCRGMNDGSSVITRVSSLGGINEIAWE